MTKGSAAWSTRKETKMCWLDFIPDPPGLSSSNAQVWSSGRHQMLKWPQLQLLLKCAYEEENIDSRC